MLGVRDGSAACVVGAPTPRRSLRHALGDDAITVASFDFPESELLAEHLRPGPRRGGYRRADFAPRLGPRELVDPALARGLVELVPEYAGHGARSS